jgi:hypothetical protein
VTLNEPGGPCRIVLELPEPPNIANARLHWAAKQRHRKAYMHDTYLLAMSQHRPPKPVPQKARIAAHLRLWNLRDEDNLTASLKWVLDALKGVYFVDDSPAHLEVAKPTQEIRRSDRGVTCIIEWGAA